MTTLPSDQHLPPISVMERYLVQTAIGLFGQQLLALLETDSFVRQPCYSSRARQHFYLVLETSGPDALARVAYLQSEFPELTLAFLSKQELLKLPLGDRWPFATAPRLLAATNFEAPVLSNDECFVAMSQAVAQIGHIARNYYLTANSAGSKTWAIRQLGWALKYAQHALCDLSRRTVEQAPASIRKQMLPELPSSSAAAFLPQSFEELTSLERKMGEDDAIYSTTVLQLNNLTQQYAGWLAGLYPRRSPTYSKDVDQRAKIARYPADVVSFVQAINDRLSDVLLGFFIHGSTARGEATSHSDIDRIGVFRRLDSDVLGRIRQVLQSRPGCSVYSMSRADFAVYPDARFNSMSQGPQRALGDLQLLPTNQTESMQDAVAHNLATIRQIARSYLITRSFGPRSLHLLNLMMKLAHHGVMRPLKLKMKLAPETGMEQLISYFSTFPWASSVYMYINAAQQQRQRITDALLSGDDRPLRAGFTALLAFVSGADDMLEDMER